MTIAKFEAGKTYQTTSICDCECKITATVLSRTEKTLIASVGGDDPKRFKLGVSYDGTEEYFRPWGTYSMAPFMHATDNIN